MAGVIDVFVSYKFLQILTTDWDDQEAFKLGIIDRKGNTLRKSKTLKTTAEKNSFTVFHRLVFNIKKVVEKLPFGRSKLGSFAAALFLLREGQTPDSEIFDMLDDENLLEAKKMKKKPTTVYEGRYELAESILINDHDYAQPGDSIKLGNVLTYNFLGYDLIEAVHEKTGTRFAVDQTILGKSKKLNANVQRV